MHPFQAHRAFPQAILFFVLLLFALPAWADEHILSFVSAVTVNADASIDVTETIKVDVQNIAINHGITRDFPTRYKDRRGNDVIVGFKVVSVARDGRNEPYVLESLDNGVRIRIGDKDITLRPGPASYAIGYRVTREIGFFENFDELYWNVTGNGWPFPIDTASVRVALPPGASILSTSLYTGAWGSRAGDARVDRTNGSIFAAHITAPLPSYRGFTIAVSWPKGFVAPPSSLQRELWFVEDNAATAASLLGVLVVGAYFLRIWWRVGRDPVPGVIVPAFRPPEGLTPAAARYVRRQGFDDKTFSAAVIGLAVKGYIKIADTASSYQIQPQGKQPAGLNVDESRLVQAIGTGPLVITQSNYQRVAAARSALSGTLDAAYGDKMFRLNRGWFAAGLCISIVFLVLAFVLGPRQGGSLVVGAFFCAWWSVTFLAGRSLVAKAGETRGLARVGRLIGLVVLVPFALFGLAFPIGLFLAERPPLGELLPMLAAAAIGGLNFVFFFLLRAPTQAGRELLDKIEGFRMYLATAEEERLNILNPPQRTPDLFERYLPYALALDCSNQWSSKFTAVLAAAGIAAPAWYIGRNWDATHPASFASNLGSSLASSVAASSSPPGSSSGSGGGGSSGGGGGGGGGGGW
jgi:uncharacterized membrane protein YgcG